MAEPISAALSKFAWSTVVAGPYTDIPHGRVAGFEPSRPGKEYASTSTNGEPRAIAGTHDRFTGTMDVYLDTAAPFDTGALGITQGEAGFVRVTDPAARVYIFPVRVERVAYRWNVEGDELIGATISFVQNGNMVPPS